MCIVQWLLWPIHRVHPSLLITVTVLKIHYPSQYWVLYAVLLTTATVMWNRMSGFIQLRGREGSSAQATMLTDLSLNPATTIVKGRADSYILSSAVCVGLWHVSTTLKSLLFSFHLMWGRVFLSMSVAWLCTSCWLAPWDNSTTRSTLSRTVIFHPCFIFIIFAFFRASHFVFNIWLSFSELHYQCREVSMTVAHTHLSFGNGQPKRYVILYYGFNFFLWFWYLFIWPLLTYIPCLEKCLFRSFTQILCFLPKIWLLAIGLEEFLIECG